MPILKCRYIPNIKFPESVEEILKYETTDPEKYEEMTNDQYRSYFNTDKPARINNATKIYANEIYGIPIEDVTRKNLKEAAKKQLNIQKSIPMRKRKSNFKEFETKRFYKGNDDPFSDVPHQQKFEKNTSAYENLKKYSETEYGAAMIDRINKSPDKFTVFTRDNFQANADSNRLTLPSDFPSKSVYESTGQKIDSLAVLHHEFEHTKYGTKNYSVGSLKEEVQAVREAENPVRILNGYEPRYTYYDKTKDTTVSIFNEQNRLSGMRTYSITDPRVLQ